MNVDQEKLKLCKELISKEEIKTKKQKGILIKDLIEKEPETVHKKEKHLQIEEIPTFEKRREEFSNQETKIPSILIKIDENFHIFPTDSILKNSYIKNLLYNPVFEPQKREIYEKYGIKLL